MKITAEMLREKGACEEKVAVFEKLWPKGVDVTLKNCRKAESAGLALGWAANHLLTDFAFDIYTAARKPARTAWQSSFGNGCPLNSEAEVAAWDVYMKSRAPAFSEAAKED